jgi:hypothetical protein
LSHHAGELFSVNVLPIGGSDLSDVFLEWEIRGLDFLDNGWQTDGENGGDMDQRFARGKMVRRVHARHYAGQATSTSATEGRLPLAYDTHGETPV